MEPIVNGLETEFEADVAFDKINAKSERGQAAMQSYSLRGHPSYVLVDVNGEVRWQFAGFCATMNSNGWYQVSGLWSQRGEEGNCWQPERSLEPV